MAVSFRLELSYFRLAVNSPPDLEGRFHWLTAHLKFRDIFHIIQTQPPASEFALDKAHLDITNNGGVRVKTRESRSIVSPSRRFGG